MPTATDKITLTTAQEKACADWNLVPRAMDTDGAVLCTGYDRDPNGTDYFVTARGSVYRVQYKLLDGKGD
jgi:hypothetical protein